MINCKRCGNKLGCWFAGEDHVMDECDDYVKITNGDRIRHMTDEELAKWMCTEYRKVPWCRSDNEEDIESGKCRPQVCIICANVWLKEEVTE